MRILFVTPFYKPYLGGIERVIEQLSHHFLKDRRVEKVGVLTTRWSFPRTYHAQWPEREDIDGVDVFRLGSWPRVAPPFYQAPLVWYSPLGIKRVIDQFEPDVVQWMTDKWFWGNFWTWFWSRRQARIFCSPSFHDLSLLRQWLRPINVVLMRLIRVVQVITELEKKKIQKAYFVPANKFTIIPWGVNASIQEPSDHEAAVITIISVGRLSKHKGQEWLLKVFKELNDICSKPLRLVLVGEDEGIKRDLEKEIVGCGLGSKVVITGKVSDRELTNWYREADIFALFPEYEAFGLVFLEAMAHRLPVVTHRVGALGDVLRDKALIIDPYNQSQAKIVLTKIIEDETYRRKMGQEGYDFVQRTYSWVETASKFLECYMS